MTNMLRSNDKTREKKNCEIFEKKSLTGKQDFVLEPYHLHHPGCSQFHVLIYRNPMYQTTKLSSLWTDRGDAPRLHGVSFQIPQQQQQQQQQQQHSQQQQ